MAKVDPKDPKWGKMFAGQELVEIFIPKDKINPEKQKWLCINGESIWLAVGIRLKVPQAVADLWNSSYSKTIEAEEKMSQQVEIN